MKTYLRLFPIFAASLTTEINAQGWVAQITLQINHDLYAYERISSASVTYSGLTVSGSSATNNLQFVIKGTGPISGEIKASVSGTAFQPYRPDTPDTDAISASFTGQHDDLCSQGFFEQAGNTGMEQMYLWIEVFPRLEIGSYDNRCNEIVLSAVNCSPIFTWEVSEGLTGTYRQIPGKSTRTISVLTQDLQNLGFANPYGRKYFRVTGKPGTTSQIQAVDIFYPAPGARLTSSPPKCHNARDGAISVDILSGNPTLINDFVVTLVPEDKSLPTQQKSVNDETTVRFAGLSGGRYRVRVENNTNISVYGSCGADFNTELINPAPVMISGFHTSDNNGYAISCTGGNDGSIKALAAGGTGSYTSYEWTPFVTSTDLAQNLRAGTYQVRVRDSNGCWSPEASQTLYEPRPLALTLKSTGGQNGYDVSCYDKADGKIEATVAGGIPEYTYRWSSEHTGPELTAVAAGAYQLVVTDANHCQAGGEIALVAPEPISFTVAELSGINCAGENTGSMEVQSPANAIGQIRYEWSTGELSRGIANKPAGTYSVRITDEQGCSAARSHTLKEPAAWTLEVTPASDFNGIPIRCYGEENGALAALVRDGDGHPATAEYYTWYLDDMPLASGPTVSSLNDLKAGTYRAEIRYHGFCTLQKEFLLKEPTPVTASITTTSDYHGMAISCSGASDGSLRAVAAGGTGNLYSYLWSTGETGATLSGLSSGSYGVRVSDENGCHGLTEMTLTEPDTLDFSIAVISDHHGTPISCPGASDAWIRANATGGTAPYAFQWNSGSQGADLRNISAGRYAATATDANGCTARAERIIEDPPPVTARMERSDYNGYGISCNGGHDGHLSVMADGGTGTYTFSWNGSIHGQPQYSGLSAGMYQATVTDQNGCSASTEALLQEPGILVPGVVAVKNASCYQGADGEIRVTASGGTGNYLFKAPGREWQSADIISGLATGEYAIQIRDGNGCQQEVHETISEPAAIDVAFLEVTAALCGDARGSASTVVSGGTEPYLFQWSNAGGAVSREKNLSGASAGVYTLRIVDGNGCEAAQSIGIPSTDGPQVSVERITSASCFDARDGSATLSVTGSAPFTFLWPDGRDTPSATGLAAGSYRVLITDSQECTTVETVTIHAPDKIALVLTGKSEPACYGECTGALIAEASGGNGDYEFIWDDMTGPERSDLCAGTYKVIVKDREGCSASATFEIRQPEPVDLTLVSATPPTCFNGCDGQITVNASGGTAPYRFRWSDNSGMHQIDSLCAGGYTVTVTDANQCEETHSYTVESPDEVAPDLGSSALICSGQSHILDPGDEWTGHRWYSSRGLFSEETRITVSEAGHYWLEAVNLAGCLGRDTFLLKTSRDVLQANFLMTSSAGTGDTVVLIDVSWPVPDAVTWDFPEEMNRLHEGSDIVHGSFSAPGQYTITLSASLGECRDVVSKRIHIHTPEDSTAEEGRLGHDAFLNAFNVYPNPTDGAFEVSVGFRDVSPLTVSVWHTLTARKVAQFDATGSATYLIHVDLRPVSAGTYTVTLDYKGGREYRRLIVR